MKIQNLLILVVLVKTIGSSAQMLKTTHGPNIYVNPDIVKKYKIHQMDFVEYMLDGKKKTMLDKYEILFDTSGRPAHRLMYFGKNDKADTATLAGHTVHDTIEYDRKKNVVHVTSNQGFEYYYRYDNEGRAIYSFVKKKSPVSGIRFAISNYRYDQHSRLISSETREGKNEKTDTSKIATRFVLTYSYDPQKLLSVKEKKFKRDDKGQESLEAETDYVFEYKNGVLSRVSSHTSVGVIEIIVTPKEKSVTRK